MFSIVYSSTATTGFETIDLAELLNECRARNRRIGVTGMLLFEHGRFLQALEGPEHMVRDLMGRIERDPRHEDVRTLAEETIPARRFPDWAMGSGRIDDIEASSLAEYGDALAATRVDAPAPSSRMGRLAGWFRASR